MSGPGMPGTSDSVCLELCYWRFCCWWWAMARFWDLLGIFVHTCGQLLCPHTASLSVVSHSPQTCCPVAGVVLRPRWEGQGKGD